MTSPSIRQIAENVKVSASTVSLIMSGRADEMRISKETQKKVLDEARKLNYQPNVYARRLRKKGIENERKVIAVFCPDFFGEEVMGRFILAVNRCILEKNLLVEIVIKPFLYGNIGSVEEAFQSNLFNGIIILGASEPDAEYVARLHVKTPIIYFNYADSSYSSVCLDEVKLAEITSELFASGGHRKIAILEPNNLYSKMTRKRIGYLQQYCADRGIEVITYIGNEKTGGAPQTAQQESSADAGREGQDHKNETQSDFFQRVTEEMLNLENRPTGVFLMRSTRYWPFYLALQKYDIEVPKDMEVVGVTDFGYAKHLQPALTVIDLPVEQMVESALQMMLTQLQGGIFDRMVVWSTPRLIVRETCGRLRNEERM